MITIIKKNLARQSNLCGLGSVGGNTCELYIMHEVAYDLWPMGGGVRAKWADAHPVVPSQLPTSRSMREPDVSFLVGHTVTC